MITKKDIIEVADAIKEHNREHVPEWNFNTFQIIAIANALEKNNPNFKRGRFLDYIAGRCGPNGGSVTQSP